MKRRLSIFAWLVLVGTAPALAQGCAMCYNTVASSPKDGQRAIGQGVIILLAPPLGLMTAGVGLALRYGQKRDREWRQPRSQGEVRTRHSPEARASSCQSSPTENASSAPV